ncbi:MAG: RluA family pseudouridine synthase [Cytophagales bacterium]|nr:RluA family pseudouridine synthase [Cytophagales bacterium]
MKSKSTSEPQVIFEDNHLLVIHKPSGWLVQGDKTGDATLTDWGRKYIKEKYDKPGEVYLHPVHRLDRPVSGIVTFARTSKASERLNRLFREDKVVKSYLAVVQGVPIETEGKLIHWLVKDGSKNLVKAYNRERNGAKRAELSYEILLVEKGHSLLHVKPKTGRPHQIRVQLASMRCPIVGDLRYGKGTPNPDKSISLHAFQLSFVHPVRKEPLQLTCAPKGQNWSAFENKIDELDQ